MNSQSADAMDRFMEDLHLRTRDEGNSFLRKTYYFFTDFHSHKWLYDIPSLSSLLIHGGFVSVGGKKFNVSDIPEVNQIERADRILNGAGIVVEGHKPGT
jgi:hypothetical protein